MKRCSGGFTLIELMIVIAILSVLITVVTVALLDVGDDARANLDAVQLTHFRSKLDHVVMEHRRELGKLRPRDGEGSFADLIQAMYDKRMLSVNDVKYLGGAENEGAITDVVLDRKELNGRDHIVFTGPNTGAKLIAALQGRTKDGVMFCSNRHTYKLRPQTGMVVMFAGRDNAEVMMPEQIKAEYERATDQTVEFGGELALLEEDFYGKPPFKYVEPE